MKPALAISDQRTTNRYIQAMAPTIFMKRPPSNGKKTFWIRGGAIWFCMRKKLSPTDRGQRQKACGDGNAAPERG